MSEQTNRRRQIYGVWYLPQGSSVERLNRHPAENTTSDDLLEEYTGQGHEVVEIRYIEDEADSGTVDYSNSRFIGK